MTPTDINRRIAQLCGWTEYYSAARSEVRWRDNQGNNRDHPPDYFNSLDECRELLKRVEAECGVKIAFMNALEALLQSRSNGPCDVTPWDYLLVEPAMICEAFLIVKGEWL